MENCYIQHNVQWKGPYDKDVTPDYIKNITRHYLKWSKASRFYFNSAFYLEYNTTSGYYALSITVTAFGSFPIYGPGVPQQSEPTVPQNLEFKPVFANFTRDRICFNETGKATDSCQEGIDAWKIITSKYYCEKFPNFPSDKDCHFNPYHLERWLGSVRFLLNQSILENNFVDDLIDSWQPCCDQNNYAACTSGYFLTGDLPDENVKVTESALSPGFREVYWQTLMSTATRSG